MAKMNDPQAGRRTSESSTPELNDSLESSRQPNAENSDDRNMSAARLQEQASEFVGRNPYPSVLTGFGLGLGFGLVVTLLLTRREPTWYEQHVPDSLQEWPNRLKKVPETVASQVSQAWNRW